MDATRRKFLTTALLGAGSVGLRAFATGLPLSFFLNPLGAKADEPDAAECPAAPQFLILITSGSGDPLNANVPGTYDYADTANQVYHCADPSMAPTSMTIGSTTANVAKPWTTLNSSITSRISFMHHATYTNSHGDAAKVNRVMGAVQRQEMLVSLVSKTLAPCMNTIQSQPVVLANDLITYAGAVLPPLTPSALRSVLTSPTGLLGDLQKQRDADLDRINALIRADGTRAQQAMLDKYANSQTQLRSINQSILQQLSGVKGTAASQFTDCNIAATVLFQLNISPVAVFTYGLGGDNHGDTGNATVPGNLGNEATGLMNGVSLLNDLATTLQAANLWDKTSVVMQNVFGRTLHTASHSGTTDGRNHNANHHCTVLIGSKVKPSVIGGITLNDSKNDFRATGFNSSSGAIADTNGDVTFENTLQSVAKTIGTAVGVPADILNTQITSGTVISAAVST